MGPTDNDDDDERAIDRIDDERVMCFADRWDNATIALTRRPPCNVEHELCTDVSKTTDRQERPDKIAFKRAARVIRSLFRTRTTVTFVRTRY